MTSRLLVRTKPGTGLPGDEPRVVTPASGAAHGTPQHAMIGHARRDASGGSIIEVVVDGWRFELAVEDADRAELRERATRGSGDVAASGPTEIRAVIPGRIATVRVAAGDPVGEGESLMVVEAMKMQNELRAPRAGVVERVVVVSGQTIELGDLLAVLA